MVKKKSSGAKKGSDLKSEKVEQSSKSSNKNINYWMIATVVLSLVLVIGIISISTSGVSKKTAEKKFLEFVELQGADVNVLGVKSIGDLYEVSFEFMGEVGEYFVSKDGRFIGSMVELEEFKSMMSGDTVQTTQKDQTPTYSEEDERKLSDFNKCLAEKGVKIYGANWCGYTNAWVTTLGGYNAVAPVYVECTENEEICSSEGVTRYPTTKINGQAYNGARTIEAIAQAVGCSAPSLSGDTTINAYDASC